MKLASWVTASAHLVTAPAASLARYTIFHIQKSKLIIDMFHTCVFFSNIDGANVQISFLFWVLKAINDHLDTLDSTG